MADRKGFALIITIILILIVAAIMLGIASFIVNSEYLITAKTAREVALYDAQAGIYWSLIDYITDGSITKVTSDSSVGIGSYKVGKDANLLLVDADLPRGITTTSLTNIGLTNIGTSSITINRVVMQWGFGGNITRVTLGGASGPGYSWTGTKTSPADITLTTPYTIAAAATYANNNFTFSSSIPLNAVISVTFYCSGDGSSREAMLYNNGRSGNKEFSITATGKSVAGKWTWKRTIEATYDVGTSKITSWNETESHL